MLRYEHFSQLVGLRTLNLRNNDIGQVDGDTFKFIRSSLALLDLSQNKIHFYRAAYASCPHSYILISQITES
ncbi:hypothetical protein CEXT_615311, partial [Caerostris extrusa]